MTAEITAAVEQVLAWHEAIMPWVGTAFILLVGGLLFAMTPLSNVVNIVTVPLGYEWSSCPFCPAFSIEKIEWAECDNCGRRHRTNFGAAKYKDGNEWRFCDSDCLDGFKAGGEA